MRRVAAVIALLLLAGPAAAETRWLACKFTEQGRQHNLAIMFDEPRNYAAIFEDGQLVEGSNTLITFQAIRARFPRFFLTYNRNDGALSLSLSGSGGFVTGIVHGECRRSNPPPGAPRV